MNLPTIENYVGNTPLVRLQRLPGNTTNTLVVKLEGNNPGSSVKDRAAFSMIKGALDRGEIDKNIRLIEATSGNTGIALAMIASIYGIEIELVMPENSTRERVLTMEAFGAKVTLTDGIESARDYADAKAKEPGYFMLNQFANPDNPLAHYRTTGPEIWRQTGGEVTHFVSSMGTTGTIMGVSRYLKEQNDAIQIVGLQPADGASIPGIRRWPKEYLPAIFEAPRVDVTLDIGQQEAETHMRRLAREEGILAGVSSGGSLAGALRIAEQTENAVIVFIVCDRGDRYLSTGLFAPEV